ncbi:septal ring lytic transglycosylase RlpA family protein [Labrys portucalensis]|uniref:Endolytic peptidoglycan transglycosylase RlpA n=1 Tax=Labrys neptuniae TaxID=376174 RepID=A0ABV6Z988_9HYPH
MEFYALIDRRDIPAISLAVGLVWAVVATDPAFGGQTGIASWYGRESGRRTANGERFPSPERTCAHRTARFGSHLKVTVLATGRSVVCRVNDRGPFIRGRIVDLNPASARAVGLSGLSRVTIGIQRAPRGH